MEFTIASLRTWRPFRRSRETPLCLSTVRNPHWFDLFSMTTERFTAVRLYGLNSLSLLCVCIDLDPAVVRSEKAIVSQGQELKATCNALSSVDTHTAWFKVMYTLYSAITQTATRFCLNTVQTPTVIRMHLENPSLSHLGSFRRISFRLILDSDFVLIELKLRRCWPCFNH